MFKYSLINITKRQDTIDDNVVHLKDFEYRNGGISSLKYLQGPFVDYDIENCITHESDGMQFWDKLDCFYPPPPLPLFENEVYKLFPNRIMEQRNGNVCVIYSSRVSMEIWEYLHRLSFTEDSCATVTLTFCRQYAELYSLFRSAYSGVDKAIMFSNK